MRKLLKINKIIFFLDNFWEENKNLVLKKLQNNFSHEQISRENEKIARKNEKIIFSRENEKIVLKSGKIIFPREIF